MRHASRGLATHALKVHLYIKQQNLHSIKLLRMLNNQLRKTYILYRISPPISPGLICSRRVLSVGLSAKGLSAGGGAYTRCKTMFSEKMIQNSQFATLISESNIIFDNNLNNNSL